MATISSISGALSATQSGLQQLRLLQAQRAAEQAEQTARSLQVQAQDAQRKAVHAQENARSITIQADQAQSVAGQARQGVAIVKTVGDMQSQISNVVSQVTEKLGIAETAVVTPKTVAPATTAAPVVNTQGQLTGTVVNTTA
jgi:hypothetical protein